MLGREQQDADVDLKEWWWERGKRGKKVDGLHGRGARMDELWASARRKMRGVRRPTWWCGGGGGGGPTADGAARPSSRTAGPDPATTVGGEREGGREAEGDKKDVQRGLGVYSR